MRPGNAQQRDSSDTVASYSMEPVLYFVRFRRWWLGIGGEAGFYCGQRGHTETVCPAAAAGYGGEE